MDLDDLIRRADPARSTRCSPATVEDARRLMDAAPIARGRRDARRARRTRARLFAAIVPICGVVIAIVLAAVFLHTRDTPGPHVTGPATRPASGSSIEQRLVRELGVLRQPQTPAARAFNHLAPFRPLFTINPALTRVVRLGHGIRVWLYVVPRGPHGTHGGLGVRELQDQNGFGDCCTPPEALERPRSPGPLANSSAPHPHQVYVEVVPDRVARVQWTFPPTPSQAGIGPFVHSLTATIAVHDNIAAAVLPDRWAAQTVVWYDAQGRIIARHTSR